MKRNILKIEINSDLLASIEINKKKYAKYILGYELRQIALQKPTLILYVKYYLKIDKPDNIEIIQVLQKR